MQMSEIFEDSLIGFSSSQTFTLLLLRRASFSDLCDVEDGGQAAPMVVLLHPDHHMLNNLGSHVSRCATVPPPRLGFARRVDEKPRSSDLQLHGGRQRMLQESTADLHAAGKRAPFGIRLSIPLY